MRKRTAVLLPIVMAILATLSVSALGLTQPSAPSALEQLKQDTGGQIEITWNPHTATPSFIRGQVPLPGLETQAETDAAAAAVAFVARYADLFGVGDAAHELTVHQSNVDQLGMWHVALGQVHQGIEVYAAQMGVHLSADGQDVVAVTNGFVPGVALGDTQPKISLEAAVANVRLALPGGTIVAEPRLVIYAGPVASGIPARLAWLLELRDDALPARALYIIDAASGSIIDILNRLYTGRDRETYDAGNGIILPGSLARSEGDGPTGDEDVDKAHDFAGATYDYYWNTHGRDSFDNQGATLVSTVHYDVSYVNAFWNGQQTVYGDGMAVNDVVAHEWTHAVTAHTANLEYWWQSGALNESISDIFGAMVDREDWLIGEDLPDDALGGREAIRDMADPARFGQPAHTDDWVATCSDEEGVHTNNGIPNKAYYNIATAIGKNKAERIFYRALTTYLTTTSSLEDARAAALQSASDLYGSGGSEYNAVRDGFDAVGLDGVWEPEPNDCTCAATIALADETVYAEYMPRLEIAATLYRLRDQLFRGLAGEHYRALYEQHTARMSQLLVQDVALQSAAGQVLKAMAPGLNKLMDGAGDDVVVTAETTNQVVALLQQLANEDRARGGGQLAVTIERELARIEWDRLVGMTYDEAWAYFQSRFDVHVLFLPVVVK